MKVPYSKLVNYSINFNEEKNQLLKMLRGISFDEVVHMLKTKKLVENVRHSNVKKYPNQFIFLFKLDEHIYAAPYVIDENKKEIFLKTIYPSRKFTKQFELERK
ncbi:toxin [Patescibacteria group bacterium]|nr:toxin [Patescibacteria group bacterium]